MDRRRFLHLTSLGAASAALPAFLGCDRAGFARVLTLGLTGELLKAKAAGKPLLVLLIPADDRKKWAQGELFGAFLNHAGPAAMADLALAHVVCATRAELAEALGDGTPDGEPPMVLIETDGSRRARPLDPTLPAVTTVDWSAGTSYEEQVAAVDASYVARNQALAAYLHGVLVGDRDAIARRAEECAAVLGDDDITRLKAADDVAELEPALVDRAAAWLAQEAFDADEAERAAIEAALAAAAANRRREVPPPRA
ncbi:MAG: hypothetical protein ACF8XB_00175, partial [Planctomycetota bacterium JB042]